VTDPDVQPADPDSTVGTGQAAAPEAASSEVLPAEEPAEVATPAALPPLRGDSLRAQVAGLDELDELPVAEHIERYEAVHDELHAALRGIHDPGG
jgi:hypothetical protein